LPAASEQAVSPRSASFDLSLSLSFVCSSVVDGTGALFRERAERLAEREPEFGAVPGEMAEWLKAQVC
jgi:hypothetical protein